MPKQATASEHRRERPVPNARNSIKGESRSTLPSRHRPVRLRRAPVQSEPEPKRMDTARRGAPKMTAVVDKPESAQRQSDETLQRFADGFSTPRRAPVLHSAPSR